MASSENSKKLDDALKRCPLYFILDESICVGKDPLAVGQEALAAGVTVIQLRFKTMPQADLIDLASTLKDANLSLDWLLLVNDSLAVAMAARADGIHLGENDMPVAAAREAAPDMIIGSTARSAQSARIELDNGSDYLGIGSVFASQTKPGLPRIGLAGVRKISQEVDLPLVAIGGITTDNCRDVIEAGATGFCSIFEFRTDKTITDVIHEFRQQPGLCDQLNGGNNATNS